MADKAEVARLIRQDVHAEYTADCAGMDEITYYGIDIAASVIVNKLISPLLARAEGAESQSADFARSLIEMVEARDAASLARNAAEKRAEGAERERDEARRSLAMVKRDRPKLSTLVAAQTRAAEAIDWKAEWEATSISRIADRESLTLALEALKSARDLMNTFGPDDDSDIEFAAIRSSVRATFSTLSASLGKQEVSSSVDESAASLASELTGQDPEFPPGSCALGDDQCMCWSGFEKCDQWLGSPSPLSDGGEG